MVNRNLIGSLDDDKELQSEIDALLLDDTATLDQSLNEEADFSVNEIVDGTIVRIEDDFVVVDVKFKSEGTIHISEWDEEEDAPEVGASVQVLIEETEDEHGPADDPLGMVRLSKRKAEKIIAWTNMMKEIEEGQIVKGLATRKIKGGLLLDIGVNVFLPASQVDIRRPNDIADYIGQELECEVLKIDEARRNIVVSRRSLIERQRKQDREALLAELNLNDLRKGVVKNIADFGAFVDLGGIDGLLHITDMSWERIGHPSEMVTIDQEIEVMILKIDYENEKIALGLKQKTANPWDDVEEKYAVNSRVTGEVVNVMSYGAFVKLEAGIEGLVHISEMSWTKRINHPTELVQIGDEIDVVVLSVDREGQQLSLGMKQTQENPWEQVLERYPEDAVVKGRVSNLTNYGAFIELEEGIDGLLHVSDMSWTRKISHPSEIVEKGDEVECKVLSIDIERRRIALGLKQMDSDPWETTIPEKYPEGTVVKGTATKITNFGVFVGLEDGLEGLLHISELSEDKVENPEDIVSVGDELELKVLRIDNDERKIGLSLKRLNWSAAEEAADAEALAQSTPGDLKGGLGDGGLLFSTADDEAEDEGGDAETGASEEQTAESDSGVGSDDAEELSVEEDSESADSSEEEASDDTGSGDSDASDDEDTEEEE